MRKWQLQDMIDWKAFIVDMMASTTRIMWKSQEQTEGVVDWAWPADWTRPWENGVEQKRKRVSPTKKEEDKSGKQNTAQRENGRVIWEWEAGDGKPMSWRSLGWEQRERSHSSCDTEENRRPVCTLVCQQGPLIAMFRFWQGWGNGSYGRRE